MLGSIRRGRAVLSVNILYNPLAPQHSAPLEYDRNIVYTYDTQVYCVYIYIERERVLMGMCSFCQTTRIHQSGKP